MKRFLVSTALAGALAVCSFSNNASAASVSFLEVNVWSAGNNNAPLYFTPTPVDSLNFSQTESTVFASGVERSPYQDNTDGQNTRDYSVISKSSVGAGYATYDLNGATTISILWGSPDDYNFIAFYDAAGGASGGGNLIPLVGTGNANYITGPDLSCYGGGGGCNALHWVEVQFTSDIGIGSIVLSDSGQAAFEYGLPRISGQGELVPIPGALPLFASGLAGLGLLGWRRRKSNAKAA